FLRQVSVEQKTRAEHVRELDPIIKATESFDECCAALRQYKQREYLRIGARDLLPSVTLEETVRELTALAEASLDVAYRFCRAAVEMDYGILNLPDSDRENRFTILGMGKLGGRELNFSSDIDVIFLFESDDGESSGGARGKLSPREFFSAVGKRIIQAMGNVTEDGFVFRIDLRLRPMGNSGPLVQSVHSSMLYYESWGQCWERAALIKARPVAGSFELGAEFLKEIEPFVYRRYLDYTTVDELRHMKLRIENELLSAGEKERNLKLGYGGIREIEFFTQALQLVNGGYVPEVRGPSTLPALKALARHKFISEKERDSLIDAYRFLRQAEHKVQIVQEKHAHSIPEGKEEERALARRLGYNAKGNFSERQLFWRDHRRHTRAVRRIFDHLFYGAQKEMEAEGAAAARSVWHDLDRRESVTAELAQVGFKEPARAYNNLVAVRDGEIYAPPSTKRLRIMRTLGPALVDELTRSSDPDQALFNLAHFSHSIGGRTGFLTLLAENPKTLHVLITLFAESQFLTELFLNRPELIDTLIRVDLTHVIKDRAEMLRETRSALSQCDDTESKLNALRRYKNEEFIRIGLHDLGGAIDLIETLSQLSDLADASVEAVLDMTLAELSKKHGAIPGGRFTIIGGGKMGGRELDYNSDLDLIFVYDAGDEAQSDGGLHGPLAAHDFYVRLGQKLLSYLSAPTEEGILYKIDMQLRPSGKSGPLVSSLAAFREYHKSSSQLWERQALIKTRSVAGDKTLGAEVETITAAFAYGKGLAPGDLGEIHHLRMRMERELAAENDTRFNLKKGRGGLVDIEFITQMLQLAYGHRFPKLRQRSTLAALQGLYEQKVLKPNEHRLLSEGYLFLRKLDHRLRLERDQSIDAFEADPGRLEGIALALGYGSANTAQRRTKDPGAKLLEEYRSKRERIRACYEHYFVSSQFDEIN
ncbi:MAG TPA: bifunctional [glutamate--ammonia ligase]-adenylyl-L-tyrosine phosphorylase/[glutamate--ammonia-ligase] adenylyltransferase, partial [Candidatus Binatia bacterium]|nr:bifunctional [glutamate--ammonia ligase]-adenylyl-L-tyrosine phosphorylase/[glutamate--ammonia-ligase] adenylyltransferase [Candidatus Binatia bacterium]